MLPVFRAGGWLWQGELHGLCTCLWCSDRCCAVLEDACWVMLCVVCVRVFCGGFVNNQASAVFVGGCSLPGGFCWWLQSPRLLLLPELCYHRVLESSTQCSVEPAPMTCDVRGCHQRPVQTAVTE